MFEKIYLDLEIYFAETLSCEWFKDAKEEYFGVIVLQNRGAMQFFLETEER